MPRCPQCSKKFSSAQAVVRHMNQPRSSCVNWNEDLVRVATTLDGARRPTHTARRREFQADRNESHSIDEAFLFEYPDAGQVIEQSAEESFPDASAVYGEGKTFMHHFDTDQFADERLKNLYYPFASRSEWEIALFLLRSGLSISAIDEFLSLPMIQTLKLSFTTGAELRSRAEILPRGPQWKSKELELDNPTKSPAVLYWRDPVECLEALFGHPLFYDHLTLVPRRVYKTAARLVRVISEWLTGDVAWEMQNQLPRGATLLGAILSSDKTNISIMTGDRVAHPLLLSLANLDMDFRLKSSNHAFVLTALFPVSKFLHANKRMRGMLADRLVHACLDFVLEPLKKAAALGIMLSDPHGNLHWCFTPLAGYIADTPEAQMLAGVGAKASPVTVASHKQLGDPFVHEPRTASKTLVQLREVARNAHPSDLVAYFKKAKEFRLNGVHQPFWRDWVLSDPSYFLTPEPLHHWHRQFWDHDAKWCLRVVGDEELDFQLSVLQPHTSYRHFAEGISKLKQVTGREQRDIQRYIVGIINGCASKQFVTAIRALLDFRYLSQAPILDGDNIQSIAAALTEFHNHKAGILAAGARVGKKNKPINNFNFVKLSLLASVPLSIVASGVPIQWSADLTEHAHITHIKVPARSGNNQAYSPQICRYLDRQEKLRIFDLGTSIREAGIDFGPPQPDDLSDDYECEGPDLDTGVEPEDLDSPDTEDDYEPRCVVSSTASLLCEIRAGPTFGLRRADQDYFIEAAELLRGTRPKAPVPFRTFSAHSTAFHLTVKPTQARAFVDEIGAKYELPDLCAALADYFTRVEVGTALTDAIGGRRRAGGKEWLPFDSLQIWTSLRMQGKAFHDQSKVLPPQTVHASPRSGLWPLGRFESAIANNDPEKKWPFSGLDGHCVVQLRLIMRPVWRKNQYVVDNFPPYLAYVQRFDVVPQSTSTAPGSPRLPIPEPSTQLYVLKRATRSDGTRLGEVIPLVQLRAPVDLIPRFGSKADPRLAKHNSLEYSNEFLLNSYWHKEIFYALRSGIPSR